jgi:hypothetical protein
VRIDALAEELDARLQDEVAVMRFQTKWNSSRWAHMFTPPAASAYSCETAL